MWSPICVPANDVEVGGSWRRAKRRKLLLRDHARRLFLFSIIYLPLLWVALVIDQHWLQARGMPHPSP
jgi:heme O synthase-like polyprenyltransferase